MHRQTLQRRGFLKAMGFAAVGVCFTPMRLAFAAGIDKVTKTASEWKKILTPKQYDILREEGTEHPFTSPLLNEHRAGTFACVGCDLELFTSDMKFDSGTGWPSFFDSIPYRVETKTDTSMFMTRLEYHCARCGGHHGHKFTDGPEPTGLRYCNNGVVLKFIPKEV